MNPIQRLRFHKGLSQQMLATLGKTSQPTIALYEAGKKSPTLDTVSKLAKSLGLEMVIFYVPPLTNSDRRSLAYHQAILQKIKKNPEKILSKSKKYLHRLTLEHPHAKHLFDLWSQWLLLPMDELINCCLDPGLLGRDMRQVTPFAGILNAKERMEIIRKFRKKKRAL